MAAQGSGKYLVAILFAGLISSCSTKYSVKTYPAGAQIYTRDLTTNEKKLVGTSPVEIEGEAKLGDVFFLVIEKQNYKPKEILVRASEGETLAINAKLDPLTPEEIDAANKQAKKDDEKPKPEDPKKKEDDLKELIDELKLRIALLENTTSFYKDAMFSARFMGNGQAKFDRDKNDKIIENMFYAQQAVTARDFKKANQLIDETLAQDEYMSQAWLLKGSLRYLQNDFQGAKAAWERCLQIDPYDKIAYNYLGRVYEKLGLPKLDRPAAQFRYPASTIDIEKKKPKDKANKNP